MGLSLEKYAGWGNRASQLVISRFTLSRSVVSWCHFYHHVLHQGLIALHTVIADRAKDVEFRHVTHRGTPWQTIRNGTVATHTPCGAVFGETCHVNQIIIEQPTLPHVLFVHEYQVAEVLNSAVTVIVGINGSVPLIVRTHGAKYEPSLRWCRVCERRRGEVRSPGVRVKH